MIRAELLAEAERLVCEDRAAEYGDPADFAAALAARWSQWVAAPIKPWQVHAMLADLKLCRLAVSGYKRDSARDGAGYLALAAEVAERGGD